MKCVEDFQSIFDKDPECGFSLRGNVYMWNMLRAATRNNFLAEWHDIDGLQKDLTGMVRDVYRLATGVNLSGAGKDRVPLFAKVGYGMSKGICDRGWWIKKGLPLLKQRLDDFVGDCTDGHYNLYVLQTSIIGREVDAIVCPSNKELLPRGGLGGEIFKAAGSKLSEACKNIPKDGNGERCPEGEVRLTCAGGLKCKKVIHAVAPNCQRGVTDEAKMKLLSCYQKIARMAEKEDFSTVAIPSIGTGKYAFPVDRAAQIAADVFWRACKASPNRKFVFCIPDEKTANAFRKAFRATVPNGHA